MARTAATSHRLRDLPARRPAQLRPAGNPGLRRSARLQSLRVAPIDLTAPVIAPDNRITKTRKPEKKECTTCSRSLSPSSFPKHITETCDHPVTTCKACLKAWIPALLDTSTYDKLSCPECPEILRNDDVKRHAHQDVYERFDQLERHGIAENTPGWRWCLAATCRAGQVHEPSLNSSNNNSKGEKGKKKKKAPEDDICECHECGAKACVPCDRPYHEGETCEEYQARTKQSAIDDKASLKTIEQVCKQCPNCKRNIQKKGGCDKMSCIGCLTSFCFLCLTTYNVIRKEGHAKRCVYALPGRFDPHAPHLFNGGGGNGIVGNGGGGNGGAGNGGGGGVGGGDGGGGAIGAAFAGILAGAWGGLPFFQLQRG